MDGRLVLQLSLVLTVVHSFDDLISFQKATEGKGWARLTELNRDRVWSNARSQSGLLALVISPWAADWIADAGTYGESFTFHGFIDNMTFARPYLDILGASGQELAAVWNLNSNLRWTRGPAFVREGSSGLANLDKHFENFAEGRSRAQQPLGDFLSQPVPQPMYRKRGAAHVAVGRTHDQLVYGDPQMTVLCLYYAPGCKGTKTFMRPFLEAAELEPSIKFVMLDTEHNHYVRRGGGPDSKGQLVEGGASPLIMPYLAGNHLKPMRLKSRDEITDGRKLIEWVSTMQESALARGGRKTAGRLERVGNPVGLALGREEL